MPACLLAGKIAFPRAGRRAAVRWMPAIAPRRTRARAHTHTQSHIHTHTHTPRTHTHARTRTPLGRRRWTLCGGGGWTGQKWRPSACGWACCPWRPRRSRSLTASTRHVRRKAPPRCRARPETLAGRLHKRALYFIRRPASPAGATEQVQPAPSRRHQAEGPCLPSWVVPGGQ